MHDAAFYEGTRVLVTGASGFIGRKLCEKLISIGADVVALAKDGEMDVVDDTRWCRIDITDYDAVLECFETHQPSVVFNAAALVSGVRTVDIIDDITAVNLLGCINVMRAALSTSNPKVVLCGSMEEAPPGYMPEEPTSPYAAAKHSARLYAQMFHRQFGLDVTMTRIFMVYGPGQQDTSRLIPHVITNLLDNASPQIGSGVRQVDWIFIDDVVDALMLLAQYQTTSGRVFDIGTGSLTTIGDVVATLEKQIPSAAKPEFGSVDDRGEETEFYADWRSLAELCGWKPRISLETGLELTVKWFREVYLAK